jgi:predicted Zn-ribbon and HTH transcriptional regulator
MTEDELCEKYMKDPEKCPRCGGTISRSQSSTVEFSTAEVLVPTFCLTCGLEFTEDHQLVGVSIDNMPPWTP